MVDNFASGMVDTNSLLLSEGDSASIQNGTCIQVEIATFDLCLDDDNDTDRIWKQSPGVQYPSPQASFVTLARSRPVRRSGAATAGRSAEYTSQIDVEPGQRILGLVDQETPTDRTPGAAGEIPIPRDPAAVSSLKGQQNHLNLICKVLDQLAALILGRRMQRQGREGWKRNIHVKYFWGALEEVIKDLADKMACISEFSVPIPHPEAGALKGLFPALRIGSSQEEPAYFYAMLSQGLTEFSLVLTEMLQRRSGAPPGDREYVVQAMWTPLYKLLSATVKGLLEDVFEASRFHYETVLMQRWLQSPETGIVSEKEEEDIQEMHKFILRDFLHQRALFLGGVFGEQLIRSGVLQEGDNDVWKAMPPGEMTFDNLFKDPFLWASSGTSDISEKGLPGPLFGTPTEEFNPFEKLLLNHFRTQDGADPTSGVAEAFHWSPYGFASAGLGYPIFTSRADELIDLRNVHEGVFTARPSDFSRHVDNSRPLKNHRGEYYAVLYQLKTPSSRLRHAAETHQLFNWKMGAGGEAAGLVRPWTGGNDNLPGPSGFRRRWLALPLDLSELLVVQSEITGVLAPPAGFTEGHQTVLGQLSRDLDPHLPVRTRKSFPYSALEPRRSAQEIFMSSEHCVEQAAGGEHWMEHPYVSEGIPCRRANLLSPEVMFDAPGLLLQWCWLNIRMDPRRMVEQFVGLQQTSLILGNISMIPYVVTKACGLIRWVETPGKSSTLKLVSEDGAEDALQYLVDITPDVPRNVLDTVIQKEQDKFVLVDALETIPFLHKVIEDMPEVISIRTETPELFPRVEARLEMVDGILKGGRESIYGMVNQLPGRMDAALELMQVEGRLRRANMTAEQATRALSNYIELLRKASLVAASLFTSAISLLMFVDILLFGPSFFKDKAGTELELPEVKQFIPHMSPELVAAFLCSRWLPCSSTSTGEDFKVTGLLQEIIEAAIENTVFWTASFAELTAKLGRTSSGRLHSSYATAVNIVATPSLIDCDRCKSWKDTSLRLFIIQQLLIPAQNAIRNSVTLPLVVNEFTSQWFDLHHFPFVTAPIPKQNDLRSKDRSMKRLLHDPTAEGPKNRLRTFADAVMLQAHNQSRTLSQDPRLGTAFPCPGGQTQHNETQIVGGVGRTTYSFPIRIPNCSSGCVLAHCTIFCTAPAKEA